MRPIQTRGLMVATRAGSLLTLIIQFERVVAAEPLNGWTMGLFYIVPFCVSMPARPRASIQVKRFRTRPLADRMRRTWCANPVPDPPPRLPTLQ